MFWLLFSSCLLPFSSLHCSYIHVGTERENLLYRYIVAYFFPLSSLLSNPHYWQSGQSKYLLIFFLPTLLNLSISYFLSSLTLHCLVSKNGYLLPPVNSLQLSLPPVRVKNQLLVDLNRGSGLGLTLRGGSDHSLGIYVSSVDADSSAAHAGFHVRSISLLLFSSSPFASTLLFSSSFFSHLVFSSFLYLICFHNHVFPSLN